MLEGFRRGVIKVLGGIPVPKAIRQSLQLKTVGTGVQFVGGGSDFKTILRLDGSVNPDAEELTRTIAMATSAYCYTAVMYRASKVSEPPMYLAQDTGDEGGGSVEVRLHDIVPLLALPSPDFDMVELLSRTEIYLLTTGACAWLKIRDMAGRVARLMPFSGDEIKTASADGLIYGRFELLTSRGVWEPYDRDDIVYFKEINPSSWRTNLSRIDVALSQLDLGHQVNRTVRNFMRKAMFPGGVISPHKDWDPEDDEWDAFVNAVEAWHSGPAAAGTPLVLQGGTTFSRAAIPLKELLPVELLDRIEAVVGSVFGVAPIVLGWKVGLENSPWSQMAEARQSVYEETIIPRWGFIKRTASRQLLTPEEIAQGFKLAFNTDDVAALRADDLVRAQVVAALRDEWTRDERRSYTGQEPFGEDDPRGDQIGSSSGGGAGAATLTQLSELDPSRRGGLARSGPLPRVLIASALPSSSLPSEAEVLGEEGLKAILEGFPLEWVLFDVNTKASESDWTKGVERILNHQLKEVLGLASRYIREAKAESLDPDSVVEFISALVRWIADKGERQVAEGLYPLVYQTGSTGLKRAALMVGLDFAVLEPGLALYAKEEADFLASVMGETTGRKVAEIVQARLDAGGLLRDLRKDLEESAAFSRSRAQLVARTETTRAWNGAQRRSLSEYERNSDETVLMYKTWLNAGDARVRDAHLNAPAGVGGERKRIDEPYSNGLQEPSEPNCRCTQTFDLETVGA